MNTPDDLPAIRQEQNLLFDFYGPMLTPKQAACFTMRFIEDCSLTEIAQELSISPQAAVDFINRAVAKLKQLEKQLGLVRKFAEQQSLSASILAKLDELERQISPTEPAATSIEWIRNAISEILG